jgi:hypothetical protein
MDDHMRTFDAKNEKENAIVMCKYLKNRRSRIFAIILAVFVLSAGAGPLNVFGAENKVGSDNQQEQEKEQEEEESYGIIPLAIPFYTPETKIGIGVGVVMYNHPDNDISISPDSLEMEGIGTQKKQFELNMRGTKYFNRNQFMIGLESEINKWPDEFYGIGNNVKKKNKEDYTQNGVELEGKFFVKTVSNLYVGPVFQYNRFSMRKREKGGMLDADTIKGSDGTMAHGTGVGVEINNTEGPEFFPRSGYSFEANFISYRRFMKSEYNFNRWELNHKQYFQITGEHVIALDGYLYAVNNDVPWQMLGKLGGQERMRGFIEGKYRDKRYAALQAEYRFSIAWKFTGVVFGSAGEVARSFGDFSRDNIRTSAGLGLRFILDEREHIPLRLDFALDTETREPCIYFGLLEAF